MNELLVVLNRANARFFRQIPKEPLKLVRKMENPIGRERKKVFQYDRPGAERFKIKGTMVPHSMNGEKNPHKEAAVQFVRKVAMALKTERSKGVDKFIIVADSHLSGLLNGMLDKVTQKRVSSFIQKNLSKLSEHELKKFLKTKTESEKNYE